MAMYVSCAVAVERWLELYASHASPRVRDPEPYDYDRCVRADPEPATLSEWVELCSALRCVRERVSDAHWRVWWLYHVEGRHRRTSYVDELGARVRYTAAQLARMPSADEVAREVALTSAQVAYITDKVCALIEQELRRRWMLRSALPSEREGVW